jgi:hypothetical protein
MMGQHHLSGRDASGKSHLIGLWCPGLQSLTPGPPPFSSMNSTIRRRQLGFLAVRLACSLFAVAEFSSIALLSRTPGRGLGSSGDVAVHNRLRRDAGWEKRRL